MSKKILSFWKKTWKSFTWRGVLYLSVQWPNQCCMTAKHTSHSAVLGRGQPWTEGLLFVISWTVCCRTSGPHRGQLEQHNRDHSFISFPQCPLTCKDQEEEEHVYLSLSVRAGSVCSSPSCQKNQGFPTPLKEPRLKRKQRTPLQTNGRAPKLSHVRYFKQELC